MEAKNEVIATRSEVMPFPSGAIKIDEEQIVSSTGALSLQKEPGKMSLSAVVLLDWRWVACGAVWALKSPSLIVESLSSIGGVGIDEEVSYVLAIQQLVSTGNMEELWNFSIVQMKTKN